VHKQGDTWNMRRVGTGLMLGLMLGSISLLVHLTLCNNAIANSRKFPGTVLKFIMERKQWAGIAAPAHDHQREPPHLQPGCQCIVQLQRQAGAPAGSKVPQPRGPSSKGAIFWTQCCCNCCGAGVACK
jgi:hypothetical protein